MKNLGVFASNYGYGRFFCSEKFLLSVDEAKDLTSKLRQTPLDTKFQGERIPKELLPENLPGNPVGATEIDVSSVFHQEICRWEIAYTELKQQEEGNRLNLYPKLDLGLDSSEEWNILSLHSSLGYFLQLKRDDEYSILNSDITEEFTGLANLCFNEIHHPTDDTTKPILTRSGFNKGWDFAPFSSVKYICEFMNTIKDYVSIEDLRNLYLLNQAGKEDIKKNPYDEGRIVRSSLLREYANQQRTITDRIKSQQRTITDRIKSVAKKSNQQSF